MPLQNLVIVTLGVVIIAAINNSPKLAAAFLKLKKVFSKKVNGSVKVEVPHKEAPKRTHRLNLVLCFAAFIMSLWTLIVAVPWRPSPEKLGEILLFQAFAISMSTSVIAVMVAWFMNRK